MSLKAELNGYIDQIAEQEKKDELYWNEIIPDDQTEEIVNMLFNDAIESLKEEMRLHRIFKRNVLYKKTLFKKIYNEHYYYRVDLKWMGHVSIRSGTQQSIGDKHFREYESDSGHNLYCRNVESLYKVLNKTKEKLKKEGFIISNTFDYRSGDKVITENNWSVDWIGADTTDRTSGMKMGYLNCVINVPCTKDGTIK